LTDLRNQLLSELPELEEFTYSELQQKINLNKLEEEETILLIFLNSKIEEFQKEWKRLLILFPELEVRIIVCEGEIGQHLCNTLNLGKLPKVAIFRIEGGYDLNYGKRFQISIKKIFFEIKSRVRHGRLIFPSGT